MPVRAAGGEAVPGATAVASVRVLWLPVGAGGHVARRTSRWWELACALVGRRSARDLVHAALEVGGGAAAVVVVEMAPAWHVPPGERGVVVTGPVGLAVLGRSRFFRYEVRRWVGGSVPDRSWAVASIGLPVEPEVARALLDAVPRVPALTWGRAPGGLSRDMWNSNSVASWLLVSGGLDPALAGPPPGTRAPGWDAGIAVATSAPRRR